MTTNPKKTAKEQEHPLDDLIRTDRIPHIWCSGCGIGTAFSSCLSAIKATGIPYNRFTMVSGIGCSARGAQGMSSLIPSTPPMVGPFPLPAASRWPTRT
jgi:2-oxoglutarate/2-oxoacid ferredoxin oxidoreductase subunit beta